MSVSLLELSVVKLVQLVVAEELKSEQLIELPFEVRRTLLGALAKQRKVTVEWMEALCRGGLDRLVLEKEALVGLSDRAVDWSRCWSQLPLRVDNLVELHVERIDSFTDEHLIMFGSKCVNLISLKVLCCKKISDVAMQHMIDKLTHLQELVVEGPSPLITWQFLPHPPARNSEDVKYDLPKSAFSLQTLSLAGLRKAVAAVNRMCNIWLNLKWLCLASMDMVELDSHIGLLTSLETLDLNYNVIECLPPTIGLLRSLQTLRVRGNRISSLPPAIGQLRSLTVLDGRGNLLKTLPDEIGDMEKLEQLLLGYNTLNSLPECLFTMRSLRYLDVEYNHLPPGTVPLNWKVKVNLGCNVPGSV